jgi:hypothetical protein
LLAAEPQFKEQAKSVMDSLLKDYGFELDEVQAIADHRILRLALDAMRYQQVGTKPGKQDKSKRTSGTRPSVGTNQRKRPASADRKVQTARIKQASQTQSIDDWANALDGLF